LIKEVNNIIAPLRELITKPGLGKDMYDCAYPSEVKINNRKTEGEANFAILDVRVGIIMSAEIPTSSDSVFTEEINIGGETRTILSGLIGHYTKEELIGRSVLVICNLEPKKFHKLGLVSYGMLLAAKNVNGEGKEEVKLLNAPENAEPGDRVFCDGIEGEIEVPVRKKRYDKLMKSNNLKTDSEGYPCYKGIRFSTDKGVCAPTEIINGIIS